MNNRNMPYNLEAEQSVLGSAFYSKEALQKICDELDSDDFYVDAHVIIYNTLKELNSNGTPIDITIVTDRLENDNNLTAIGNIDYLVEVINSVPNAANVDYYIKIVYDKSMLRRLINVSNQITKDSYVGDVPANDILDSAEEKILNVVKSRKASQFLNIQDVMYQVQKDLDKLSKSKKEITGIPTGFYKIDKLTTGMHENELIIIAARPAMGKTAFALNVAVNAAMSTKKAVAIFTLEMSAEQLVDRMLSSVGQIDFGKFRTGLFEPDDWKKLSEAISQLSETNIKIDDTPGLTVADIRSKCRRLSTSPDGLSLVVIDYLQLITGRNPNNRQQEVSEISRSLKLMALELHVPVIAVAQLSRAVEGRTDKKPVMSDLRESGSIEQDADVVAFLYRDNYYNKEAQVENGADQVPISQFILGKNRNGPTKTVDLLFKGQTVTFLNYTDESEK